MCAASALHHYEARLLHEDHSVRQDGAEDYLLHRNVSRSPCNHRVRRGLSTADSLRLQGERLRSELQRMSPTASG